MKIALISDQHEFIPWIDNVDMAIFCGDFSFQNHGDVMGEMVLWNGILKPYFQLVRQRGIKTIACPGNHDFLADKHEFTHQISDNFDLYENFGIRKFNGLNLMFFAVCNLEDWAIFVPVEKQMAMAEFMVLKHAALGEPIDILITHCPPHGILDCTYGLEAIKYLANEVKPKLHVFGHIHEARGIKKIDDTLYVNAAYTDRSYRPYERDKYFVYDTETQTVE